MTALAVTESRFEFVLYPNRPLSTAGFVLFMAVVTGICAALGAAFLVLGAWPVTGFLALDVLALYLAFRWVRRESRRLELIRLDHAGLVVRRILPRGDTEEHRLEPYWARVEIDRIRGNQARLAVRSHGQQLEIGRFLTLQEKRELQRALSDALASLRP
jgi:uncharacterized membrane protein